MEEEEADEEDFEKQDWEMEDSGITDKMAEKMFQRLYFSLGSIKAGNTSSKLRRAVVSLLAELKKRGLINQIPERQIFKDL